MGYTTDFTGRFDINKRLDDDTYNLLVGINATRRMKRKGLDKKYGVDGEFYFNPDDIKNFGQTEDSTIVDYNRPPQTQPGLWCQWCPTEDRMHIEWDYGEKFYDYVEWINYLITRILAPRGYILNGEVEWQGEDRDDIGKIIITNNVVKTKQGYITFGD